MHLSQPQAASRLSFPASRFISVLFLFILCVGSSGAQVSPKKSSEHEYPIVFDEVSRPFSPTRDVYWDVYVMDQTGKHTKRLTSDHQSHNPSWSPSGQEIVYIRDESAIHDSASTLLGDFSGPNMPYDSLLNYGMFLNMKREIMRISSDGKQRSQITTGDPDVHDVSWLPDGDHVAIRISYRRDLQVRVEALHQLPPDYVREEPLVQFIAKTRPALPPSRNYFLQEFSPLADNFLPIVYAQLGATRFDRENYWSPQHMRPWTADRNASLCIISLDGSPSSLPAPPFDTAWSRDGQQVAYSSFLGNEGSTLYVADVEGTAINNTRRITEDALDAHDPSWSPDGLRLAFSGLANGGSKIFMINRDGTNILQISRDTKIACSHATWSPDGRWIAAECRLPQTNPDPVVNALGWFSNIYLFDVEHPEAAPSKLTSCFSTCGAHNPSFVPTVAAVK